jgi:hypothetical protein
MADSEAASASLGQARVVAEFRANGGKVGGFHAGLLLLLLTTTGARTGQQRATPLTYLPDGDRYVVAAANGGAPSDPPGTTTWSPTPGSRSRPGPRPSPPS